VALAIDKLVSRPRTCTGVHVHRYIRYIRGGALNEREHAGRTSGRAGGMKCGVASRYCRRLQIKYPISLFGTNQPIYSSLPIPLRSPIPFCNVNLARNLRAPQRLRRLITAASVRDCVGERCTGTIRATTTTTAAMMARTSGENISATGYQALKRAVASESSTNNPFNPSPQSTACTGCRRTLGTAALCARYLRRKYQLEKPARRWLAET